jgi:hypothetical protein
VDDDASWEAAKLPDSRSGITFGSIEVLTRYREFELTVFEANGLATVIAEHRKSGNDPSPVEVLRRLQSRADASRSVVGVELGEDPLPTRGKATDE